MRISDGKSSIFIWKIIKNYVHTLKVTFLPALCSLVPYVPYVPHVLCALVTCVLSCPFCLVLLCPICLVPRALRALRLYALVPHVPRALHVPVLHKPHSLHALVLYVLCVSRACDLCGLMPRALFPYIPYCLIPCILYILLSPFCALEFPCVTLLFLCLFAICDFFWEFTKVRTKIDFQ